MKTLASTLAVSLTLFSELALAQTNYTFTKIAETTDPTAVFPLYAMLSDTGSIAYNVFAYVPNQYALTQALQPTAYVNEGGITRQLGDPTLATIALDINSSGSVLFAQFEADQRSHLYIDTTGTLTEVSGSELSFFAQYSAGSNATGASLNDNGDVVFGAVKDSGVWGIYLRGSDGTLSTVAEAGSTYPMFSGPDGGQRINNNRNIAFNFSLDSYFGAAGSQLADISMITPELSAAPATLGAPALNNSDTVVFCVVGRSSSFPSGALLQSIAGGPAQPVILGSGPIGGQIYTPAINDSGTIAYFATDPATFQPTLNVLSQIGIDPQPLVRVGDPLFDDIVSYVGSGQKSLAYRYLNNSGQLVFAYILTNGARGLALATPAQ